MAKESSVIDYCDLEIPLTPAVNSKFKRWLKSFENDYKYIEITPKIRAGKLQINSTDLIAFLGFVDISVLSEIDIQRFKNQSIAVIKQQLLKSLSLSYQAHYKWCLTAFKNLPWGRYLTKRNQVLNKTNRRAVKCKVKKAPPGLRPRLKVL